ncbi:MAG: MATE family efflux transporter, partial [Clostridiales bacterium]|nr:MATE family efflux transporter [Clostridiales bacterium]
MAERTAQKLDKTRALGEEPVGRLVLRFASTTLAALLFNALYSLTDTLFVSWGVGDNAMGGVSIVFPFVIIQGAVSTAVGGGAAAIVSRKLGQG